MEYKSILNRIEEQNRDQQLSAKLFRYTGLIQAIQFFSQKLNFEQIIDAGFDFINELITIERSAVFVQQGNNYVLKKLKGHGGNTAVIKSNENLKNLAILHGTILYTDEQLKRFFDDDVLKAYHATICIPLIIENSLYGFIFISNKAVGELNDDDYIISEALMRLFSNALENYKRFEELQKANKDLDEKIFNLFAINQSSKALLSELSLDILYNLSVDVFSELTQNTITGFIIYDDKSEKYVLKAYKDIYYSDMDLHLGLTLNKMVRIDPNRLIINASDERDIQYFNSIFVEGMDELKALKVRYIVLLIKNGRILGLVTLGSSVTGTEYKTSMFELIESLASSTYIALSNAQLLKQVSEQKMIIQGKLEKLVSLNNLMKNINSSVNVETLLEMTLKTLEVSFYVDKAIIGLYNHEKEAFSISRALNVKTRKKEIKVNESWKRVMEGDTVFEATGQGVENYLDSSLLKDTGKVPGILIIPICIERVDVEILGVLIILNYAKTPIDDEENMLTMETIAGHIAPVLSNLFTIEEQKRFLLPNYIELFKKDLKREIAEATEFSLELDIFQIVDNRGHLFKENAIVEKLKKGFDMVYIFSNSILFVMCINESGAEKKLKRIAGVDDVTLKKFTLGKDFKSYQGFFEMF